MNRCVALFGGIHAGGDRSCRAWPKAGMSAKMDEV
jgi:hypothetical protein